MHIFLTILPLKNEQLDLMIMIKDELQYTLINICSNDMFSFLLVCESCVDRVPACSQGEILAVDQNSTNRCCPQYYCGEWLYVWATVFCFHLSIELSFSLFSALQCVMLINALNPL